MGTCTEPADRGPRAAGITWPSSALVVVARSILVIVRHLINDPTVRFTDPGPNRHSRRMDPERKTRDLVRRLKALGQEVTLVPTA